VLEPEAGLEAESDDAGFDSEAGLESDPDVVAGLESEPDDDSLADLSELELEEDLDA